MPFPVSSFFPTLETRHHRRQAQLRVSTALTTLLGLGVAADTALAQEVTISEDRDTSFATSTIDDGSTADVTVESGVNVSVENGTAATLDSDNTITNDGTIESTAADDATGVRIDTGAAGNTVTGGLINNSSIGAGEQDSDNDPGSGVAGVLIDGDGTFVGDIGGDEGAISVRGVDSYGLSLESTMQGDITLNNVTVAGDNARAVSITGTLDGNLETTGNVSANTSDGTAIAVDGRVTGSIVNHGSLNSGLPRRRDGGDILDAEPGIATVQIGGRAEGGFLNDHYFVDSDGNRSETGQSGDVEVTGAIDADGGAPAILISPTGSADAFVGAYGGSGYAIINEGSISTEGQNIGTEASAIRIQGATVNDTDYGAVLDGGLLNRSNGEITASAVDGEARAIEIGSGGVVPRINNAGTLQASTNVSTDQDDNDGPGGDSYGILIRSGASVNRVINSGDIVSQAAGAESSAYGIVDRSGSLTSISNSGEIAPVRQADGTGRIIAIDVSANTSGVSLSNSGNIGGEILFGSGADSFSISGGDVASSVEFGAGANSMSLSGSGAYAGDIASADGTLSLGMSGSSDLLYSGEDTLELTSLTVAGSSKLRVPATVGRTSVSVSGNAVISGTDNLVPVFTNIIEDEGTVTLIEADSLSVADPDNLISIPDLPYFYTIEGQFVNETSAGLLIQRKTASDLGLTDTEATLYENSIAALNSDTELATAVGNITTEEGFTSAYRQMQPASYGSAVATAAIRHQDLAFGMISNRMDAMRDTLRLADRRLSTTGFWAQESFTFYNKTESDSDPGFDGNTIAFAIGYDTELLGLDTLGIAVTQGWSSLDKDLLPGKPLDVSQTQVDIYGSWSSNGFFLQGLAAAAYNSYESERVLQIGDFERTSMGEWNGHQFSGNLTAGYEIQLNQSFRLTPSNSISYMSLKQKAYEETGGGGMNLAIDSSDFTSVRNSARLQLAYFSALDDEAYFKLQLNGGWIRSLDSSGLETSGSFAAEAADSFTLVTDPMAKNTLAGGLGIAYVSGTSTLSVNYDYGRSDDLDSHAASVTWYMRF